MRKTTKKKIAPIVIATVVVLYVGPLVLMLLASMGSLFGEDGPASALFALAFLMAYLLLGGAVVIGVLKALVQRLHEIDGGEEDEASRF